MLRSASPRHQADAGERSPGQVAVASPGKVTYSGQLQCKAEAGTPADPAAVHATASQGISGPGGALPHGATIQALFGRHDISGVRAHTDGAAADACDAMGAQGFAAGSQVAFRGSPDLHTAAHEAAHTVQQRGGVQLAGGVGRAGDHYEQHADAVADAVVAGRSAEGLLDQMAGGRGGGAAVQHLLDDENAPDPGGKSKVLTEAEVADLLAKIAAGTAIRPSEQRNLRTTIEAMDNQKFTACLRALDAKGQLQAVLKKLYGHAASATGGANQREFPVACYRFWNAADQVDADVATANTIYGHHGVLITAVTKRVISKADTERVVGHSVNDQFKLDRSTSTDASGGKKFSHADMVAVVNEFVPKTAIGGLWAKRVITESGDDLSGTSSRAGTFPGYNRLVAVTTDNSGADTFAHELGHILIDEGHTASGLMEDGSTRDKTKTGANLLTSAEVTSIRASALGWVR